MSGSTQRWLLIIIMLLLCLPAAIFVTFLLLPLWSWIEAAYRVEAVGHSGPADWCFELVYAALASTSVAVMFLRRRSKG